MSDLPGNITAARDTASRLSGVAGDYAAGEQSVIDVLRGKIQEAYSSNADLIGKLDQSIGQYLPSPQVGREKFQNIFNPFQRESLVSQYTANQAVPMLTNAGLLGQRMGRIEDLIGAGTRAFGAESTRAQGRAQTAQQQYQNLLNEYSTVQQLQAQQEADKLAREKFEWDKAHPSGGSSAPDLSWIADLFEKQEENTFSKPTEQKPKPLTLSQSKMTNVNFRSPKGQWHWDWGSGDWIPIVD